MKAAQFFVSIVLGLWFSSVRLALAEPPVPKVVSSAACDIEPAVRKQQTLVRKRVAGDILMVGEDGKPAVLKAAQVLLVCRGRRADKDQSEWDEECQSALVVCPAQGPKLVTNEVPGIQNSKADGGDQTERLALELFRMPVEGAALVLVAHTSTEDCCGNVSKLLEHSLYLVYRNSLRKILSYQAASNHKGEETSTGSSNSKLQPGTTATRGLTDLVLQTTKTSSNDQRQRSVRKFSWTGGYYDGCGQGCGPGQVCCNGNCALDRYRSAMGCREDDAAAQKTPAASSAP